MAISFVSADSAQATSITIPTHQKGDLILMMATGGSSVTVPAGWTEILSGTATTNKVGYKIAASSGETSGTWSGATGLSVGVYRGASGVGNASAVTESGVTRIRYAALTLSVTNGSSWVVGVGGITQSGTYYALPPSGMVNRTYSPNNATKEATLNDTNGGAASWPQTDVTTASLTYRTFTIELLAAPGADVSLFWAFP